MYSFNENHIRIVKENISYGAIVVVGTGIYSKLLWKNFGTNLTIGSKNSQQLQQIIKSSSHKINWHLKGFFVNLLIIPSVYYSHKYGIIKNMSLSHLLIVPGLSIMNSIGFLVTHSYNKYICSKQLKFINNLTSEQNTDNNTFQNEHEIKKENNLLWNIVARKNENNKFMYIIYNSRYDDLFFTLDTETMANNFMDELRKLSIEEIEFLAENPYNAKQKCDAFVSRKKYTNMLRAYYYHHNIEPETI